MKILPIQFSFNRVGKYLKTAPIAHKRHQQTQDIFTKTQTLREKYLDRLYEIFPKKQLNRFYFKINQDFKIDYPARLSYSATNAKSVGTHYSFNDNTININLCEILDKDHKIIDKKTGKTMISPFNQMPIFLSKQEAMDYKNCNLSSNYAIKPITTKEQRKFILHKIAHEVVKAQQFMIMRQTQRIGDKGIIKAQNHSDIIRRTGQADNYATYLHANTFWKNHQTKQNIPMDCSIGRQALIWLDSVENNLQFGAMQSDANQRAYNYIVSTFGEY